MTRSSKRKSHQRGSATVEFALLISFLLVLFLTIVDFSKSTADSMALDAAAQAGARYGAAEGNLNDTSGMGTAATAAAPAVSGMAVTATTFCTCTSGGSTVNCSTATCNTYDLPMQYVKVQTSATVPLLFHFGGIPLNIQMSATAVLRAN